MTKIITKLAAGEPLSLRDRVWLWCRNQGRDKRLNRIGGWLVWSVRAGFAILVALGVIHLGTPLVGRGIALIVAAVMWTVMGTYWLS